MCQRAVILCSITSNRQRNVPTLVLDSPAVSITLLIIQYDYCIGQQWERYAFQNDNYRSVPFHK